LRKRGFFGRFAEEYPETLRYHHALAYHDGSGTVVSYPALVALFEDTQGYATGILRIYLSLFGTKAKVDTPKKAFAVSPGALSGSAIRLFEPTGELAIAEGLETALAVRMLSGIPTWAAGSASMLESIKVPRSIHTVHVCPDNDARGIQAGNRLAKRMLSEGKDVRLAIPDDPGADWADVSRREVVGA
jgi:putative DNA primase/helicase